MQIERPFGDNNQTILCNVPPMLPGELFRETIELKMSSGVEPRFGDFSISAFLSRYLAGNHPFSEGNGRTARLFLDGMLEKTFGDKVPLLTYRLSPACSGYLEAQELMNIGDPQSLSHPFWREAVAWSDQLQITFVDILSASKKQLHSKIGMNRLSAASAKLLNRLWSQPIVCQRGLLTLFDMDINAVRLAVNELTKMGILDIRKIRSPENAVIYDCPIIFAAYTAMDDAIFVSI